NPQSSSASRIPPNHVVSGTVGAASSPSTHHRDHHHQHAHHHHHHHPKPNTGGGVPAVDLPRHWLTPGVALAVGTARICRPGYAGSVRDVPDSLKTAVYARYGIAWVPYAHEVDHLISLELGGANSIRNLWPEPYAGRWGAATKDVLENRLHDLVCAGQVPLASAQHQEATDWVAAYRRYVGTPPSGGTSGGSGSGSGGSAGDYYASRYPTADTIYCADDPEWRSLSKTYLVHFATWTQAHARFPSYHLHQPC
ncbi:MAG: HNH endonuclease signature motif containing protein, partial [Actinomycetota bacterium]